MLSARYMAQMADGLVELYSQLENDIIVDMARRLEKVGKVTETTQRQAMILQEMGGVRDDINRTLAKYDKTTQKQLAGLFDEALTKSMEKDVSKLNADGLSESQLQIMQATVKKTASAGIVNGSQKVKEDAENGYIKVFSGIQRATMTIADSCSNEFVVQANKAYMKVASGAFDYQTALKQGVEELAQNGIHTVEYTDSGHVIKRSIESALRANILTGINQTATQITIDNCMDLDCKYVEVSAHMGARDVDVAGRPWANHASWQGKIYALKKEDATEDRPYFYDACGYGEPDGICGINCRHSFYPYFEGQPREYSDQQLDEYKENTVTYNDQEMTQYEAEQMQRGMERNMRKAKREVDALEVVNLDATQAKTRLAKYRQMAIDFTKQTGLKRNYSREYAGKVSTIKGAKTTLNNNIGSQAQKLGNGFYTISLNNSETKVKAGNVVTNTLAGLKKSTPMSMQKADGGNVNPRINEPGGRLSCQSNIVTLVARLNGFDVQTIPWNENTTDSNLLYFGKYPNTAFIDRKSGASPVRESPKTLLEKPAAILKWLKKDIKPGRLYALEWDWKNMDEGHIVALYKNTKGELVAYDADIEKIESTRNYSKLELQLKGQFAKDDILIQKYFNNAKLGSFDYFDVTECDLNGDIANKVVERRRH